MSIPAFDFREREDARYCPACGAAYRPVIDRCAKCDERLLFREEAQQLAAGDESDAVSVTREAAFSETVVVARLGDPTQTELVLGALDEADIPHRVDALTPQFGLEGGAAGSDLHVPNTRADEARRVIADLTHGVDAASSDPTEQAPIEGDTQGTEAPHRLSRKALRFRLLRGALLVGAGWYGLFAASLWRDGLYADGAINAVIAVAFLSIWTMSFPRPRGAFAAGTILSSILLVLMVALGFLDPSLRVPPEVMLGNIFAVLAMYWGWQSAPARILASPNGGTR